MNEMRLADPLAALSHTSDLGMGYAPGSAVRTCLLAVALARRMNVPERDLSTVYYTALLEHVGCTAYAHETATLFGGDDIAVRSNGSRFDFGQPREAMRFLMLTLGQGQPPAALARAVVTALRLGSAFDHELSRANCEVATHLATRLHLEPAVRQALDHMYERWDGKGQPRQVAGDAMALAARVTHVASQAILFHQLGGLELSIDMVGRRAGTILDPGIASVFLAHGDDLLAGSDTLDVHQAALDAEPEPRRRIPAERLGIVAEAFAGIIDLKSPYLHGHSRGVAAVAGAAAASLGLDEEERRQLRIAGLLHDLGRVGVPTGIWNKPGQLTTMEWEQVRLHPYHTERILARSPALAPIARLAGMHHERLDGSGYYRQAPASEQPVAGRILAAADAFQAMTQERPHRPAHSLENAARELESGVAGGQFDAGAVRAVLGVAGVAPSRPHSTWPANLSGREVEVLRLAARGLSTKAIGDALSISPKTADHHIQHIYAKIGVSTRAGAALFAIEHDLIQPVPPSEMG